MVSSNAEIARAKADLSRRMQTEPESTSSLALAVDEHAGSDMISVEIPSPDLRSVKEVVLFLTFRSILGHN